MSSGTPHDLVRERGGRRERGGKEKKGGERRGGKMGVKVRGGREVYAARACAGNKSEEGVKVDVLIVSHVLRR